MAFACKMPPPIAADCLPVGFVLILPIARVPSAVRRFTKKITQEN
jgi:hypothetical protein